MRRSPNSSFPAGARSSAIVEASFLELLAEGPAKNSRCRCGRRGRNPPAWRGESLVVVRRRRHLSSPWSTWRGGALLARRSDRRSDVHATTIEQLDETGFDAATCILTAHFVPDDGSKLAFFEAIHARLKPGAPLAIVDGVGVAGEAQTELLRRIWKRHAIRNGVAEEEAESNAQNFKKVAVVSAERRRGAADERRLQGSRADIPRSRNQGMARIRMTLASKPTQFRTEVD